MTQSGNGFDEFKRGLAASAHQSTRRSLQFTKQQSPVLSTVHEASGPPHLTMQRPVEPDNVGQPSSMNNSILRPSILGGVGQRMTTSHASGLNTTISEHRGAIPRGSRTSQSMPMHNWRKDRDASSDEGSLPRNGTPPNGVSNNTQQLLELMTQLLQQNATMLQQNRTLPQGLPSFHVMPDLTKAVGDFLGHETPVEARQWLNKIESTARVHNWPEAFLYETATMHLKQAAKSWFQAFSGGFQSWQHFRETFKKTWIPPLDRAQLWEKMQNRKQRESENFSDYYHEKVKWCKTLGLTFEETRRQVSSGLLSRDTAVHALSSVYRDEDELFHGLVTFERSLRVFDQHRQRKPKEFANFKSKNTFGTSSRAESIGSTTKGFKKGEEKSRDQIKCYNCQKFGHYASKCSEEKKVIVCSRCGESGHHAKICSKPIPLDKGDMRLVADTNPGALRIEGKCESSGFTEKLAKYLKTIKINDCEFQAMIDPGSSDCTIKASAVLCNDFTVIRMPSTLSGFGTQDRVVKSCGVVRAKINVDDVEGNGVLLRIVPDDVQGQDVLIGRTFTELDHIVYLKVDERLVFVERSSLELSKIAPGFPNGKDKVPSLVRDEILPPASINFVNMETENETLPIPIINYDRRSKELKKGTENAAEVMNIQRRVPELQPRREAINEEEVFTDAAVTPSQRQELVDLLNEFRVCVAQNIFEIGKTSLIEMDIQVKPGSVPVSVKPYRTNRQERDKIKEIVKEWKDAGLVRETSSPYASPVLLVQKKNGDSRLVVDYRKLNAQTERINYPLPNIDEYLEVLNGAKLFATLDLAHGYLQLPLKEEACAKTAFITPDETGEFTRTMFGLMNAPFYFSKMMELALGSLRNKFLLFYLDDVLVLAKDWSELMERLRATFEALQRAGLTMRLSKCKFGMDRVEYLGFVVTSNGIEPGPVKIEAILKFPIPLNVHEVRRFIGMASFFRRFVANFAKIIAPLTELTRKTVEFKWTEKENQAFMRIKELLTSKPVLGIYNPNASRTELHTDASCEGLGAILFQSNEKNELHPIFAVSKRTSAVERSYHSSKLELMAIVWSVERLRVFLLPLKFTILTDCQALVYLNANKTINPQVVRWSALLSEYDFEIRHRKGTAMQHVDALSRAPVEESMEDEVVERAQILQIVLREDEILIHQYQDNNLKVKIDILRKAQSDRTKIEHESVRDYKLRDGLLYKTCKRDNRDVDLYVVPDSMRKAIAIKYHDLSSHFGVDKTLAKIQTYYYFPKMRAYVRRHIAQCLECILSKKSSGSRAGELHSIPPGKRPFSVIHVDHVGPFITSKKGSKYILGIIDTLTKFVIFEPVKNVSAALTIRKLEKVVQQFGAPDRIISDRGTSFTAKSFEEFCLHHGIQHTLNSSRHPQANGLIERMNRTLLPAMIIRTEQGENSDWDSEVKEIERDINSSISKATGRTPFESLYGYQPRFGDGRVRDLTRHCEAYRDPLEIRDENRNNIEASQRKSKERYDEHRRLHVKYDIGDIVYVQTNHIATGESTKLQRRFRGPYVITAVYPSDTYVIVRLAGGKKVNKPSTAHVSQLKLWRARDNYSEVELENDETRESQDINCNNDDVREYVLNDEIEENGQNEKSVIKENDEIEEIDQNDDDVIISEKEETEKEKSCNVSEIKDCDVASRTKERIYSNIKKRERRPPAYLRDYIVG